MARKKQYKYYKDFSENFHLDSYNLEFWNFASIEKARESLAETYEPTLAQMQILIDQHKLEAVRISCNFETNQYYDSITTNWYLSLQGKQPMTGEEKKAKRTKDKKIKTDKADAKATKEKTEYTLELAEYHRLKKKFDDDDSSAYPPGMGDV